MTDSGGGDGDHGLSLATYRRLRAQALRLCRRVEDAEDLVQDTLVRAISSAGAEKSRPVIRAPRRDRESVSVPIWHCRWTPRAPETSPSSGWSKVTTPLRCVGSATNFW